MVLPTVLGPSIIIGTCPSPHTQAMQGGQSSPPWRALVVERLKLRNQRQVAPFSRLLQCCEWKLGMCLECVRRQSNSEFLPTTDSQVHRQNQALHEQITRQGKDLVILRHEATGALQETR